MSREFLRSVAGRQLPGLGEVAVYWSDLDYTNIFDTKDFSFDDKPVPESNTFPELIEHNAEGTAIALLIALNACAERLALERQIIAHLIDTMRTHGWKVDHVDDGGDECRGNETTDATLEHVFSVDESQIIFEDERGRQHWVTIILGNGADCIADYSYANHNADTFRAVMEKHVDPFVEALQ